MGKLISAIEAAELTMTSFENQVNIILDDVAVKVVEAAKSCESTITVFNRSNAVLEVAADIVREYGYQVDVLETDNGGWKMTVAW